VKKFNMATTDIVDNLSSDEESNDDKENDNDDSPAYLKYENFTHTPLGLETYNDGLQHPIEMRRILTGDLSNEVSVSYKESPEESFRDLSYPKTIKRPAPAEAMPSISLYGSPSILPKPPKLLKGGTNSITSLTQQSSPWPLEDKNKSMSEFIGHSSFLPISPRKPGRPSTAGGTFDPETGSVRYACRLQCGASLASAKGRRKHEKKHCPNFGKVAPPILRGQQPSFKPQMMGATSQSQNSLGGFAHSLFGAFAASAAAAQNMQRERRVYECRYCGKVLKTYEGRRLHEKLQHVAKQQTQPGIKLDESQDDISTEDNKQLLIEHLKAAGMDPSVMNGDPSAFLSQDDSNIGEPTIEYGEEEEEDDDEEDFGEAPSSDGLEISHN